jgi:hypothetical protein
MPRAHDSLSPAPAATRIARRSRGMSLRTSVTEVMGPGLKIIGAPTTIARRGSKAIPPAVPPGTYARNLCSIVWRKLHPPNYRIKPLISHDIAARQGCGSHLLHISLVR